MSEAGGTTLPPLAGAPGGSSAGATLAAASPPQWRQRARRAEAPQRQAFLDSLLNEDLQRVTKWHGARPHHEQKRFLRSVDTLYRAFQGVGGGGRQRAQEAAREAAEQAAEAERQAERQAAAAAAMAEEDPLNGPPRTPSGPRRALSEPALAPAQAARPIEVFEARKRRSLRGEEEGPNSLLDWLEGQSVTTGTTGTTASSGLTRFSQLTKTSSGGSICSEPGTTNQAHYRVHRRGRALNRPFGNKDQHSAGNLKDGIPSIGFPDSERMHTVFRDTYGAKPLGENITRSMYGSVFKDDQHQFLGGFLEQATSQQREHFAGMVRSLEYLRRNDAREHTSQTTQDYNLHENSRLWKPPTQKPVFDPSQRNLSLVPMGSTAGATAKRPSRTPQPAESERGPPSPSVSGLGSLPLTRLSTPLVVDLVE